MAATPRLLASAVVGGMLVVGISGIARAQVERAPVPPVARTASLASGSIFGVVLDERGLPVAGAVVSALGTTTVTAVTDKAGKFELRAAGARPVPRAGALRRLRGVASRDDSGQYERRDRRPRWRCAGSAR